jgi:hypothetical protein
MNAVQRISMIVTSQSATLAQLELTLGQSARSHHDLGTARPNGLVYQQSVWFGYWSAEDGEIEDLLDEVLVWVEARKAELTAIDRSALVKIVCKPADGGLAVAPATAARLAALGALLCVDVAAAPGDIGQR